jgi:hypothetical protein
MRQWWAKLWLWASTVLVTTRAIGLDRLSESIYTGMPAGATDRLCWCCSGHCAGIFKLCDAVMWVEIVDVMWVESDLVHHVARGC